MLMLLLFAVGYGIGTLIQLYLKSSKLHSITICETSDVHGKYHQYARISTYLNQLKEEGREVILIDNGDNLQGSPESFYYNYIDTASAHIFSRIADYVNYDAIVVGNHDIETGHKVYDRLAKSSKIPYLAANVLETDNDKPYFKPYTVIKRAGLKIAIIGMTNANVRSWVGPDKYEGLEFRMISEVAQQWVDRVRKRERPHLVILSIHSGYGPQDGEAGPDIENEARYLAQTLEGVDMVLCGHDHRRMQTLVDRGGDSTVAILNPGAGAEYVAQCDVQVVLKRGKVAASSFTNKLVELEKYKEDEKFVESFKSDFEIVKSYSEREICELAAPLDFEKATAGPSEYLSLIHAAQLERGGADISLSAPLTTRGSIEAGPLQFGKLMDIYRFENTLYVIEMTGKQILGYLEFSYDNWLNEKGPTYNWDSAEGINYTVSRSASFGERVKISTTADGEVFNLDKIYKVAVNSYRASGGGGHMKEGAGMDPLQMKLVGSYPDVRTVVGEYLEKCGTFTPKITGNWEFVR